MAILEYVSNLSSLLDVFLVLVAVATAGFLIKVKFIAAAERKAAEVLIVANKLRADFDELKKEFYEYRLRHAEDGQGW